VVSNSSLVGVKMPNKKGLLVWVEPLSSLEWWDDFDNMEYRVRIFGSRQPSRLVSSVLLSKAGFTPPKSGRKRVKARLRLENVE